MSDVFVPTNTKGLCARCKKTRGMHHFELVSGEVFVYCTPPKKGDAPVATSSEEDIAALWEPTPTQCSSCGHTDGLNGGKYFHKINDRYRYCLWCSPRGGRGNVMRLILTRALADEDCREGDEDNEECKCLVHIARKWSDHPFAQETQ